MEFVLNGCKDAPYLPMYSKGNFHKERLCRLSANSISRSSTRVSVVVRTVKWANAAGLAVVYCRHKTDRKACTCCNADEII